jgi:hypothetical protein
MKKLLPSFLLLPFLAFLAVADTQGPTSNTVNGKANADLSNVDPATGFAAVGSSVVAADDFARHAEGTLVAHGSSPLTGSTYRMAVNESVSGVSSRYPVVTHGGLLPQGSGLMYVGSDLGETVKRMDFEITNYGTGGPNARNIFTIATSASAILGEDFNDPDFNFAPGALHIQFSIVGITDFGISTGGTSFNTITPDRGTLAAGIAPWNPNQITGGVCDIGRPWRLTLEFEGTTCRITAFGNTYEYTDPRITAPRHWFWECRGIYPGGVGEFTVLNRYAFSRDYSDPFRGVGTGGRLGDFLTAGRLAIKQETLVGAERVTHQVLTLSGNLSNNDTITIGTRTYTAKSSSPGTDQFLIGANASATIDNLAAAINKTDGFGTLYGADTTMHAKAWAALGAGDTMVAYAKDIHDTSLATTKSAANASWGAVTMEHKVPVASWTGQDLTTFSANFKVNGDAMTSGWLKQGPTYGSGPWRVPSVADTFNLQYYNSVIGTEQVMDTMTGGQLLAVGDSQDIEWSGVTANTANTKRFVVRGLLGTLIWDSGDLTSQDEGWELKVHHFRTGSGDGMYLVYRVVFTTDTIRKVSKPISILPHHYSAPVGIVLHSTTSATADIRLDSGRCVTYTK